MASIWDRLERPVQNFDVQTYCWYFVIERDEYNFKFNAMLCNVIKYKNTREAAARSRWTAGSSHRTKRICIDENINTTIIVDT